MAFWAAATLDVCSRLWSSGGNRKMCRVVRHLKRRMRPRPTERAALSARSSEGATANRSRVKRRWDQFSSGHCCGAQPPRRTNCERRGVASYVGRRDVGPHRVARLCTGDHLCARARHVRACAGTRGRAPRGTVQGAISRGSHRFSGQMSIAGQSGGKQGVLYHLPLC